jgi:hypothetical protein
LLPAFAVLLVFQCLGEGLVFLFNWPVPGPVTGMLLLLAALLAVPRLQDVVEAGATELLRHLSLLLVAGDRRLGGRQYPGDHGGDGAGAESHDAAPAGGQGRGRQCLTSTN